MVVLPVVAAVTRDLGDPDGAGLRLWQWWDALRQRLGLAVPPALADLPGTFAAGSDNPAGSTDAAGVETSKDPGRLLDAARAALATVLDGLDAADE
jgi:hypothetical protein